MDKNIETKCYESLEYFIDRNYIKAYSILFDELGKTPNNEIIKIYLAVFSSSTGNQEVSDFYISEVGFDKYHNYITLPRNKKLLSILLSNKIEDREWRNYRRPRNKSELNRIGITAPLCRGDVLEVGCASGDLSTFIAMHATNVFGIDIDPVAIELARYKVKTLGLDNCYFNLGDGAALAFQENTFDTVILAEVLEHVPDPAPFIEEALRICKHGGRIVISVPKGYAIPDPDHVRIFTKQNIASLINSFTSSKINWINEVPGQWILCYIDVEKETDRESNITMVSNFLPPHKLKDIDYNEKVSIILPTYNRASHLKEALESLISQTYKNKEIIVVNDGSTDDTELILSEYQHLITYISKKNGGKSSAINLGMESATGKYIWIFDDDDIALPKKLEVQIRKFQENKSVGLIHTSTIYFQKENDSLAYSGVWSARNIEPQYALKEQIKGNRFFTPSVIVRRECYETVGKWDENLIRAQDYDMWMRICRHFNTMALPLPTLHYRVHSGTRGTAIESIQINNLQEATMKYHRLAVKKTHDIPIEEIYTKDIRISDNTVYLVESFLERALYMAKNNLLEECSEDIERAKDISMNSKIQYLNFSINGLQIIKELVEIVSHLSESRSVVNILYFARMIQRANSR
ncbi:glycosyltransferase [Mesobacillus jeotgali]|uniref:glycosyltransferase n=1 Tax=Mesobacillus jeotgali TaxID=129985 RepID=UPI00177D4EDC|nr:glycosyltransferase [Mesobacillus jeotgali]UYZ21608.1 glycosyltransferase [Mesobacillus jeotgali]